MEQTARQSKIPQVAALREALEQLYPGSVPITQRVAPAAQTGIAALDRLLPGGGFPRGKLVINPNNTPSSQFTFMVRP